MNILLSLPPSIHLAISLLSQFLVCYHFILNGNQSLLHTVVTLPVSEQWELGWLNLSCWGVHTWQVDLGLEMHLGWGVGVVGTAFNGQEVNSVVEVCVGWPNDCSVPVCEWLVVTYSNVILEKKFSYPLKVRMRHFGRWVVLFLLCQALHRVWMFLALVMKPLKQI